MSKFPNMKYYGGPDQEETEIEVAMKNCDVCGNSVEEITLKFYRDFGPAGTHVCQECRPEFDKCEECHGTGEVEINVDGMDGPTVCIFCNGTGKYKEANQ